MKCYKPSKHTTLLKSKQRQNNVKTTSCAYWEVIRESIIWSFSEPQNHHPYSNGKVSFVKFSPPFCFFTDVDDNHDNENDDDFPIYQVHVITGDVRGAGTNADVFIIIIGSEDESGKLPGKIYYLKIQL